MRNTLNNRQYLYSALTQNKLISSTSKSKQRGVILLLSLVLLLVLTVITGSMVRSALIGVNTTAALQRNTIVHHALSSVLVKEVDYLHNLKDSNNALYELKLNEVIDNGTSLISGERSFEDILGISADQFKKSTGVEIISITSVLAGWKHVVAGTTSSNPSLDNVVPKIERKMCDEFDDMGGKDAAKDCFNYVIMVTAEVANLRGNDSYKIEQIVGFSRSGG